MPQFRVLKKSTRERIYVDKIDPREHLHITGVEFTSSMIKDISERNGSNTFKSETKTEVSEAPVISEEPAPKTKKSKK